MGTVTTSHHKIAEYWSDKYISPDGKIGDTYVAGAIPVITDFGEPCCWACGLPAIGKYEETLDNDDVVKYNRLWDDKDVKSKLNRCHIVPAMFGGKDTSENLFLMCEKCHLLSPDTQKPSSFFRWVYHHREETVMGDVSPIVMLREASNILEQRGVGNLNNVLKVIGKIDPNFKAEDMAQFLRGKLGWHGHAVVDATRANVLADYFEKKIVDVCLSRE